MNTFSYLEYEDVTLHLDSVDTDNQFTSESCINPHLTLRSTGFQRIDHKQNYHHQNINYKNISKHTNCNIGLRDQSNTHLSQVKRNNHQTKM